MTEERENLQFGAIAIKLGFTTLEAIDDCIRMQEKMKSLGVAPQRLGEIMLARGCITEAQTQEIFKYQGLHGGHTTIQGYKVITKIGQGTMGAIYKAIQISMDRIVAIKVLSPRYANDERFRQRFLREARAVARLNHPNIIQGIDVGESNGVHYFAMEHIDGPTVGELIRRGGALDEKRGLNIITQIARALDHASQQGIIHRDIKPDNIMLTSDGIAKLLDLGLAKLTGKEDLAGERRGASMGTPFYISPEQARGEHDVDGRSDIYSLGATAFHVLAGEPPFPGQSAGEVISKHLTEVPIPLRQRNAAISPAMEHVVMRMLRKAREERHQNASELLADLEAIAQGGDPAGFEPPAPPPRAGATARARRSRLIRRSRLFRRR